jgi:hypothetical protein
MLKRTTIAMFSILLVAACGGGAATAGPGGGGATTGPGATAGATAPGAATQGPAATQPGGGGGGGGGTASSACELLKPEEAAASLGTAALTTTGGELAGQTFCDYRTAAGETVLTTYMQASGAGAMWGIWESSLQTEPVSGIGDKAMFEASTKLLFVLKGDAFFNVFVADISLSPEQALEKEKALATIMVGRL